LDFHNSLRKTIGLIDNTNDILANALSKLLLIMVVVTSIVVLMRKGFDFGSIALQESVTYMHGSVFILCFAGCLVVNQHVRVDIFYRDLNSVKQAWVNLLGSIFLAIPFVLYIVIETTDYALASWKVLEGSKESGGLPYLYLLKTVVPLGFSLLLIQIVAEALYSISRIMGASWDRGDRS